MTCQLPGLLFVRFGTTSLSHTRCCRSRDQRMCNVTHRFANRQELVKPLSGLASAAFASCFVTAREGVTDMDFTMSISMPSRTSRSSFRDGNRYHISADRGNTTRPQKQCQGNIHNRSRLPFSQASSRFETGVIYCEHCVDWCSQTPSYVQEFSR